MTRELSIEKGTAFISSVSSSKVRDVMNHLLGRRATLLQLEEKELQA